MQARDTRRFMSAVDIPFTERPASARPPLTAATTAVPSSSGQLGARYAHAHEAQDHDSSEHRRKSCPTTAEEVTKALGESHDSGRGRPAPQRGFLHQGGGGNGSHVRHRYSLHKRLRLAKQPWESRSSGSREHSADSHSAARHDSRSAGLTMRTAQESPTARAPPRVGGGSRTVPAGPRAGGRGPPSLSLNHLLSPQSKEPDAAMRHALLLLPRGQIPSSPPPSAGGDDRVGSSRTGVKAIAPSPSVQQRQRFLQQLSPYYFALPSSASTPSAQWRGTLTPRSARKGAAEALPTPSPPASSSLCAVSESEGVECSNNSSDHSTKVENAPHMSKGSPPPHKPSAATVGAGQRPPFTRPLSPPSAAPHSPPFRRSVQGSGGSSQKPVTDRTSLSLDGHPPHAHRQPRRRRTSLSSQQRQQQRQGDEEARRAKLAQLSVAEMDVLIQALLKELDECRDAARYFAAQRVENEKELHRTEEAMASLKDEVADAQRLLRAAEEDYRRIEKLKADVAREEARHARLEKMADTAENQRAVLREQQARCVSVELDRMLGGGGAAAATVAANANSGGGFLANWDRNPTLVRLDMQLKQLEKRRSTLLLGVRAAAAAAKQRQPRRRPHGDEVDAAVERCSSRPRPGKRGSCSLRVLGAEREDPALVAAQDRLEKRIVGIRRRLRETEVASVDALADTEAQRKRATQLRAEIALYEEAERRQLLLHRYVSQQAREPPPAEVLPSPPTADTDELGRQGMDFLPFSPPSPPPSSRPRWMATPDDEELAIFLTEGVV